MTSLTPRIDNLSNVNNLIINGNMDFWQRGTSFAAAADGQFFTDRFKYNKSTSAVLTFSQSSDVPTLAQSGFSSVYSASALVTTGAASSSGSIAEIMYTVEGNDFAAIHGKKVRLQFWCKTNVQGTYAISMFNTGFNTKNYCSAFSISAPEAGQWVKKSFDIQMDDSSSWHLGNNGALYLFISLYTGSSFVNTPNQWNTGASRGVAGQVDFLATTNNYFKLAQVMLCDATYLPTDADIPFKRAGKTIGDELRLCQRYCVAYGGTALATLATGRLDGVNNSYFGMLWPVKMRATPTSTSTTGSSGWTIATAAGANSVNNTASISSADSSSGYMNVSGGSGGGGTTGHGVVILSQGVNSLLIIAAEL